VYGEPGSTNAYRLARQNDDQLWNEYICYSKVVRAYEDLRRANPPQPRDFLGTMRVPEPRYFVNKNDEEWWAVHREKVPAISEQGQGGPGHVVCMERVLPLPQSLRDTFVDNWGPTNRDDAKRDPRNADCIARIYLGQEDERTSGRVSFFTLRNFKLPVARLHALKCDVDGMTKLLGATLAIIHWEAGLDSRDIEVVVGSKPTYTEIVVIEELSKLPTSTSTRRAGIHYPNFLNREISLWVIDFNLCRPINRNEEETMLAVEAFWKNDPYFPRPHTNSDMINALWDIFMASYLEACS
ncbi:zinc finger protein-domain-containing protein, partial [Lineolata rhizophorae]